MCGLVGIINREKVKSQSDKLIKVFIQSLYTGALRGVHGTGILAVTQSGGLSCYKKALPSSDFIELTKAKTIINDNNEFLCGHNRFATQGGHTAENAHPFTHGNVTMFHNGTLDTWKWMAKDKAFSVDSECLAYALSKSNDKVKLLESIDGAFSLVWYDSLSKTLNFARNKDRPMFFGMVKNSESIIYASESGMIEWLASRNGIELSKIASTEVGSWLEIPLDIKEKCKITKFIPKELEIDYRGYYSTYKTKNTSPITKTVPSKHQHLIDRKETLVKVLSWAPYNDVLTPNRWGKLICILDNIIINVSSISEKLGITYKDKQILVKVSAAAYDDTLYANFIRVADEEDLAIESILNQTKQEESTKKSNVILLSAHKTCCNCDDEILPSELKDVITDEDGSVFCRDCSHLLQYANL